MRRCGCPERVRTPGDRAYQGRPRDYEKIKNILPSAVRLPVEVSRAGLMESHELEHHAAAIGGWGYISVAFDDRDAAGMGVLPA